MLPLRLLWLPWALAMAEECDLDHSSYTASTALKSLHCYNDFQSFFHCTWREEPESQSNQTLKLWLKAKSSRKGLCEDYPSVEQGLRQCRYKTRVFSLGTTYTAFFNKSVHCSTAHNTYLDLSTLLRARTPVSLTTSSSEDGGRTITWSSPYPQSSSLNNNITYELSYRSSGHQNWTEEKLWNNHKKLEKKILRPGHRYEVRVRALVPLSEWSHWSPTVSWFNQPDVETAPPVECVLWGDQEVQCRWEQSTELVHFISYQLVCRQNQTAPLEQCCEEPSFSLVGQRGDTVKFSCLIRLKQPPTSSLQVALEPKRSIKTFNSNEHIRPYPPTHVKVKQNGHNWIVEWTPPKMRIPQLDYTVCYYNQEKELENMCSDSQLVEENSADGQIIQIPKGSSSVTIPGLSLIPSHRYRVKVRTYVMSPYNGTPSDWSAPVEWTSHKAVWPVSYWIYMAVAVLMSGVFLTLFIFPACRRKTILWVESVPSPSKSKVILEIQTAINPKVMQLFESTYQCKALDMDSISTCSSYVSLWSNKNPNPQQGKQLQQAEGEEEMEEEMEEEEEEEKEEVGNESRENVDHSSMSFTGPYIFCQPAESNPDKDILEQTELSCPDVESSTTVRTISSEEGYVRLPSHTMLRSVLDLPSVALSTCSTEENQHCMNEDCSSDTFWPHGSTIQSSGYCQLPTGFTIAQSAPQLIV
ncbi:hypothetical protein NL108_009044 [Boleophthalmus pectinirostris]|nr:hypothetical protein NL108_009044 [Boleophthalmus pectinirostris]